MRRLTGYGLRLASQFPVPGAMPDDGDGQPDVTILMEAPEPTAKAPVYARSDDGLRFVCPEVASYRIAPDSILVAPDPDAQRDMVSAMLIATALPALLWLRGRFVLHAAAARLPGGSALAITGAAGSGKSTVLAQLAAAGARLIGDDTIAFDAATGRDACGLGGGWFVETEGVRRFVTAPAGQTVASAPIAAILVLEAPGNDAGFTPLAPVAAVAHLLANSHRPRVPALLGRIAEQLRDATLLAGEIPLYSWRRRMGAESLSAVEWTMIERIGRGKEIE